MTNILNWFKSLGITLGIIIFIGILSLIIILFHIFVLIFALFIFCAFIKYALDDWDKQ